MFEDIKRDLGVNFKSETEQVLKDYIERYTSIASDKSNRDKEDKKLIPYITEAVKASYIRRGDEGTLSSSEGSISKQYYDIEEKLARDCKCIRLKL